MEELDEEAKEAGISVMNEIGLDPGQSARMWSTPYTDKFQIRYRSSLRRKDYR